MGLDEWLGIGEDLVVYLLDDGDNDSQYTANYEERGQVIPTDRGWGPEGPSPFSLCTERGGKDDSNIAPFRTNRLATHLLSNVM